MRHDRKAFTLIEVAICMALISIIFFPFMAMTDQLHGAYHKSIRKSARQAELESVCYRIQSQLRAHPDYRIDADNRGATWLGGKVRWEGEQITMALDGKEVVLSEGVTLFSLHRRAGRTYLNLARQDDLFREDHRLMMRVENL